MFLINIKFFIFLKLVAFTYMNPFARVIKHKQYI